MSFKTTSLLINIFLLILLPAISFGQLYDKMDTALRQKIKKSHDLDYIVVFNEQADLSLVNTLRGKVNKAAYVYHQLIKTADKSQSDLIEILAGNNIYYEKLIIVNALRVKSDATMLNYISERPEVKYISLNFNIATPMVRETPVLASRSAEPEWGIKKIKADSVWMMGYEGQNVVIGGQDTGYDWKVSPLKTKYRGYQNDSLADHNYNWHDAIKGQSPLSKDSLNPCGYNVKTPCDDSSHGTHTMGTMVGRDSSNSIGVAPGAQWMACRNMERGNGQLSTYLECFEFFLAPTDLDGNGADVSKAPHVINNSWFCSEEEGCNATNWLALKIAVENLKASGVVVVVSAGNSGPSCSTVTGPPALFEPSFSVGATMINDTIASFSSRGPVSIDGSNRMKPDVSAPGRNVRSVIPGGNFANFSGTSMAGPHVTGLVALIISANPSLAGEVALIENIIKESADAKFTDQECGGISGQALPNPIYGFGRVNALKAVQLALSTHPTYVGENNPDPGMWKIYPNPAKDILFISNTSPTEEGHCVVKIYDVSGKLVLHSAIKTSTDKIDVSGLNGSSLYLINIVYDKKVSTYRFIKE